ncbi:MAG TPA: TetR/AcrR family transcriptional regulator [Candidatus Binatia bacterium]|nr:TetR/AcrR family transcriptional regulator [Candidatus Binatia bacterium]
MECALRVFARRGLGEARHAEIAEEAGVAVPTVFFYFPTREALVDSVLQEVDRFLIDMALEVHASDKSADEVMLDHIIAFTNSVDSHPDHARVWLDWSTAIREVVWPRYLDFQDRIFEIITATLQRGQVQGDISRQFDAADQARLLVGSAHMLAQMKFAGQPREKLEQFFRTLVGAVLGHPPS